jgi:hypothetical protein
MRGELAGAARAAAHTFGEEDRLTHDLGVLLGATEE